MVLNNTTCECLWIQELLTELRILPNRFTIINVDNQAAIKFTENSQFHTQLKHINICHYFIWEHIASNKVSVQYCATDDNLADIFTKALPKAKHEHFAKLLGMTKTT